MDAEPGAVGRVQQLGADGQRADASGEHVRARAYADVAGEDSPQAGLRQSPGASIRGSPGSSLKPTHGSEPGRTGSRYDETQNESLSHLRGDVRETEGPQIPVLLCNMPTAAIRAGAIAAPAGTWQIPMMGRQPHTGPTGGGQGVQAQRGGVEGSEAAGPYNQWRQRRSGKPAKVQGRRRASLDRRRR